MVGFEIKLNAKRGDFVPIEDRNATQGDRTISIKLYKIL
jgi:hypothetical protein